ncbi:MAG: LysM domain-containing protein [Planctomycetota bacterium]
MRKLYIALALIIVFLAVWLIDWNIRQGSSQLREGAGSIIEMRDDDIIELEIGRINTKEQSLRGKTQEPAPVQRLPQNPQERQRMEPGSKTVVPLDQPEPEPASQTTPQEFIQASHYIYEVQPGDTISEIALEQLGSSKRYKEIMELNGITDAKRIQVGMKLKIPQE